MRSFFESRIPKILILFLMVLLMHLFYSGCSKNKISSGDDDADNKIAVDGNGFASITTDASGRARILSKFFDDIDFEISNSNEESLEGILISYAEDEKKCFIDISDPHNIYAKFNFWGHPVDFYTSGSSNKFKLNLVNRVASTLYASYPAHQSFKEIGEFSLTGAVDDELRGAATVKTMSQIMDYIKSNITTHSGMLTTRLNLVTLGEATTSSVETEGAVEATNAINGHNSGSLRDFGLAWYNHNKSTEWPEANANSKFIVREFNGTKNVDGEGHNKFKGLDLEPYNGNNLLVYSNPSNASIYIDGANMNVNTPADFSNIEVGNHVVRVYKTGYNEYKENVSIALNGVATVFATLGEPKPPMPVFNITNPDRNEHFDDNVVTVTGTINLRDAHQNISDFTGTSAVLTLNGVDQEIPVTNGTFNQEVLINSGQNTLRMRANSLNGDTGVSEEITFYGDFQITDIQVILRWNNGTSEDGPYTMMKDVDLHVYDADDHHTYWLCSDQYSGYDHDEAVANMIPGSELDIDNTWGYGPETFTVENSPQATYTVWAHFYSGYDVNNPTYANVEIIFNGYSRTVYGPYRFSNSYRLMDEYGYYLDNTTIDDPDCWWEVATFNFSGSLLKVNATRPGNLKDLDTLKSKTHYRN